jgi:hypothetical protein
MKSTLLTDHALSRARERVGLNRVAAERMALRAHTCGLHRAETHGQLRDWLETKVGLHGHPDMRIYGEHVWVFGANRVITILWIPLEFRASARRQFLRSHSHLNPRSHR